VDLNDIDIKKYGTLPSEPPSNAVTRTGKSAAVRNGETNRIAYCITARTKFYNYRMILYSAICSKIKINLLCLHL